jgi:predicted dinucleotide-binding enzyme
MNAACVTVFSEADHDDHRLDRFLTGNDTDALETAAVLVADAGFNPVLAVDLAQLSITPHI